MLHKNSGSTVKLTFGVDVQFNNTVVYAEASVVELLLVKFALNV